jgi:enoyl-CoA hydratase/carnithine racemase
MNTEYCRVETDGKLLIVTLNRPEQLNALHKAAHYELAAVFDAFDRNPEHWACILTGEGRAFCAGADLKSGPLDADFVPPTGFAGLTHRFERAKPIVAAVNGLALGGGFELALACDIIVAAETAKLGATEVRVGLYAAAGGIQRLIHEIGVKRAHALLLTGRHLLAPEGARLGLINEVTPADEVLPAARRWADDIIRCSPTAIAATKAIANDALRSMHVSIQEMMGLPAVQAVSASPDLREGARAFAERRAPKWSNPACLLAL